MHEINELVMSNEKSNSDCVKYGCSQSDITHLLVKSSPLQLFGTGCEERAMALNEKLETDRLHTVKICQLQFSSGLKDTVLYHLV